MTFLDNKKLKHLETYLGSKSKKGDIGMDAFERIMEEAETVYDVMVKGRDMKKNDNIEACINGVQPYENIKTMLYRLDDEIETGDYLVFNDITFICDKLDRSTVGYNKRKIQECNNTLKFKDGVDGKIYEFPCIVQDKTSVYADGLAMFGLNIIADDMTMITVPNNKYIASIPSFGYRFIFDNGVVYKTTRKDMLTDKGYITFRCLAERKDERDDFDNNIAYQEFITDIKDDIGDNINKPFIEVSGYGYIREGQTLTYNVRINNSNLKDYVVEVFNEDGSISKEIEIFDITENTFKIKSNTSYKRVNIVVSLKDKPEIKDNLMIECKGGW